MAKKEIFISEKTKIDIYTMGQENVPLDVRS